jgi:beta-phosphoglucomutase-like phosphatase (HAD superfamily)
MMQLQAVLFDMDGTLSVDRRTRMTPGLERAHRADECAFSPGSRHSDTEAA